ncbi:MAG: hypothetical protein L6Q29_00280 [Candidatus Pacebacteria bacterium]|nr:hypothetical protein [Candidatus Paceibacterota bacterium]
MHGCGRSAGRYGKVVFNFAGYKFKITKLGSQCEECAKEKFLKNFDIWQGRLIKNKKGIIVDWSFYSGVHNDIKPQLNEILLALGVLEYKRKGNWEIVGSGMILNPGNLGGALYFTRRKDVVAFAKTNYGRAHYFCEIRKISAVIDKEKFSKS